MKQGTLITRVVIVLLFLTVCVYLIVSAVRSLDQRTTYVTTYTHTVDDAVEVTGLLVREEVAVTGGSAAIVDLVPDQGEKVRAGAVLAYLYQDEAALDRRRTLRTLLLEEEQLKYALQGDSGTDSAELDKSIINAMTALKSSVSAGDLTGLEEQVLSFKSLVIRHGYSDAAGVDELTAAITAVEAEIAALQSAASLDTAAVIAPCSGTFSALADGYESLISPAGLETLTADGLRDLLAQPPQAPAGAVGSLITSSTWYFATTVAPEVAQRLEEESTVRVRFSRDWSGEVTMTVERVAEDQDGTCLVILSADRSLADTSLLRRQTVEFVFHSVTGIRVPKKAVRTEMVEVTDPETGRETEEARIVVYVLTGAQAESKPIEILADDGAYYLVQSVLSDVPSDQELKNALRAGDQVILSSEALYDGKVMVE